MKKWLRRIRGALGLGVTWAMGWLPIGALVGLVVGVVLPGAPVVVAALRYGVTFALLGLVGGGLFSTGLRLTEGHRRFDQLSLPRFTGLGAVGGLLLGALGASINLLGASPLSGLGLVIVSVTTVLGAGSAAATLTIARRADDRELLEAGEDVAEVGLSAEERRRLLGGT